MCQGEPSLADLVSFAVTTDGLAWVAGAVQEAARTQGVFERLIASARAATPAPSAATEFAPFLAAFVSTSRAELLAVLPRRFELREDVEASIAGLVGVHGDREPSVNTAVSQ